MFRTVALITAVQSIHIQNLGIPKVQKGGLHPWETSTAFPWVVFNSYIITIQTFLCGRLC